MTALKVILSVVFLIISVALMVIVLLQEGKSAGLTGSISGGSETYWGKNKSRSAEGKLEKLTKYGVILFMVLALVLNML
ncbi:MAG: preprotein translocase subunit SecG [Lachnospiraceae bacterium]|nr:preprotein translocase subunit SecG [Lachnospiraceae bacterium]